MARKRKRKERCSGERALVMGPRLLESAPLSHNCLQGESRREEKGRRQSSPLSHCSFRDLLDGGKHFFNFWGLQFLECFRFNLTNPLPRHREALSNLLQRAGLIVANPEA